ncbi:MAG: isoprenylcysteine carboxylmethyltransferase family protein [Anaerolineaceae bacterium]|nr:isoprenylcysteine carboxylmethyltransferase family protein [Anaerolineaceae bacterium]
METKPVDPGKAQEYSPRQWLRLIFVYLLIPLILFICAGDFAWWQAWVFSILIFAAGIAGRILAERRHPGLLAERVRSESIQDAKPWDKVLAPLMAVSIGFPVVIVAGLDHRFGWSDAFPTWVNLLGLVMVAFGYAFAVWALIENRYFSGVVRIQTDRGHVVCDSGPYRIVRHPGYAGNILPLPGIVLGLSSIWTLVPAAAALIIIVIRTVLEDKTLQAELPGYREYAERVRYKLIPWIY